MVFLLRLLSRLFYENYVHYVSNHMDYMFLTDV